MREQPRLGATAQLGWEQPPTTGSSRTRPAPHLSHLPRASHSRRSAPLHWPPPPHPMPAVHDSTLAASDLTPRLLCTTGSEAVSRDEFEAYFADLGLKGLRRRSELKSLSMVANRRKSLYERQVVPLAADALSLTSRRQDARLVLLCARSGTLSSPSLTSPCLPPPPRAGAKRPSRPSALPHRKRPETAAAVKRPEGALWPSGALPARGCTGSGYPDRQPRQAADWHRRAPLGSPPRQGNDSVTTS